jgi:hypothetical protein
MSINENREIREQGTESCRLSGKEKVEKLMMVYRGILQLKAADGDRDVSL